jgi:hypothetical protein
MGCLVEGWPEFLLDSITLGSRTGAPHPEGVRRLLRYEPVRFPEGSLAELTNSTLYTSDEKLRKGHQPAVKLFRRPVQ